jgi:hypothetical protein
MRHLPNHDADPAEARLDSLFAAYRDAVPDPEAGADFMPRVWRGIEARRAIPTSLRQIAQSFITAAAAICLFLSVILLRPSPPTPVFTTGSYVEVLASDPAPERLAYAEISRDDLDGEDVQQ